MNEKNHKNEGSSAENKGLMKFEKKELKKTTGFRVLYPDSKGGYIIGENELYRFSFSDGYDETSGELRQLDYEKLAKNVEFLDKTAKLEYTIPQDMQDIDSKSVDEAVDFLLFLRLKNHYEALKDDVKDPRLSENRKQETAKVVAEIAKLIPIYEEMIKLQKTGNKDFEDEIEELRNQFKDGYKKFNEE